MAFIGDRLDLTLDEWKRERESVLCWQIAFVVWQSNYLPFIQHSMKYFNKLILNLIQRWYFSIFSIFSIFAIFTTIQLTIFIVLFFISHFRDGLSHSAHPMFESKKLEILRNITDLLGRTFSSQFVFPVLGHEDGTIANFRHMGELWRHWLPSEALHTFEKGI